MKPVRKSIKTSAYPAEVSRRAFCIPAHFSLRAGLCLLVLLISLCQARPLFAFFPEFRKAAQKVDTRLGGLTSLQLEIVLPDEPRLQMFLWIKHGHWRQEWVQSTADGHSGVVAAAIGKGRDCRVRYAQQMEFPLPILFFWYRKPALEFWRQYGIQTDLRSYRFFKDVPCLVFGAEGQLTEEPQIWLNLEQHVPVRLKTARGQIWTWFEYRNIGNFPLPHKVRVQAFEGSSLEMEIIWRGVNRELSDHLFDTEAFRQKFHGAPAADCRLQRCEDLYRILPASR